MPIHESFCHPEMTVKYVVLNPGQIRTRTQPGFRPEIEISDIKINDGDISDDLYITILNEYRGRIENEIVFCLEKSKGAA